MKKDTAKKIVEVVAPIVVSTIATYYTNKYVTRLTRYILNRIFA